MPQLNKVNDDFIKELNELYAYFVKIDLSDLIEPAQAELKLKLTALMNCVKAYNEDARLIAQVYIDGDSFSETQLALVKRAHQELEQIIVVAGLVGDKLKSKTELSKLSSLVSLRLKLLDLYPATPGAMVERVQAGAQKVARTVTAQNNILALGAELGALSLGGPVPLAPPALVFGKRKPVESPASSGELLPVVAAH